MWCLLELLCRLLNYLDWAVSIVFKLGFYWKTGKCSKNQLFAKLGLTTTSSHFLIFLRCQCDLVLAGGAEASVTRAGWVLNSSVHLFIIYIIITYIYYIIYIYIYIHILWLYMTMLFSKHVAAKAWNSKLQVSAKQGIAGFIGCKAKRTRLRMASFCFVAFVQRISKCADWWLLPESAGTLITKWWAWKSFSALGQGQRCSGDDALVNFGRREDAAGSNSAMKPCLVP